MNYEVNNPFVDMIGNPIVAGDFVIMAGNQSLSYHKTLEVAQIMECVSENLNEGNQTKKSELHDWEPMEPKWYHTFMIQKLPTMEWRKEQVLPANIFKIGSDVVDKYKKILTYKKLQGESDGD